MTVNGKLGRIY